MEKTLLFIHGAGSYEGSNHIIKILNHSPPIHDRLLHPRMPNPKFPRYSEWKEKVIKILTKLDGEVVLVGHLLGSTILLKVLSEEFLSSRIRGIFLIATPYWGEVPYWQSEDFSFKPHFPSKLPQVPIFFYHSEDDEIVPFSHLLRYRQLLPQAHFRILKEQGHCFDRGDFPELLSDLAHIGEY